MAHVSAQILSSEAWAPVADVLGRLSSLAVLDLGCKLNEAQQMRARADLRVAGLEPLFSLPTLDVVNLFIIEPLDPALKILLRHARVNALRLTTFNAIALGVPGATHPYDGSFILDTLPCCLTRLSLGASCGEIPHIFEMLQSAADTLKILSFTWLTLLGSSSRAYETADFKLPCLTHLSLGHSFLSPQCDFQQLLYFCDRLTGEATTHLGIFSTNNLLQPEYGTVLKFIQQAKYANLAVLYCAFDPEAADGLEEPADSIDARTAIKSDELRSYCNSKGITLAASEAEWDASCGE
jgi:hypothetical protein